MKNLQEISVEVLPGVGKQKKEALAELGIHSIADLLSYFPYRYEDYRLSDLSEARHEERVTVEGQVYGQPSVRWYGKKKSRMTLKLLVHGIPVQVVWFNQAFLKNKLQTGKTIVVSGKWDRNRMQLTADRTLISPSEIEKYAGRFEPVYSVSGKIKVNWLRKLIHSAFQAYGREIGEILPQALRNKYRLIPRATAMYYLHFPKGKEEGRQARRRMVYEELFLYELKIMWLRRIHRTKGKGLAHAFPDEKVEQFINGLSFPLTGAQQRVTREILNDLREPVQMNRLLQGDVGSGKTVVAAIALYANYLSGYQGAIMVPTEILAEQHASSLQGLLSPWGLNVITLTGSMTAREKREAQGQIKMGLADVVVGTHALIQEVVEFRKLGLVITDEQHRFGVKQRAMFREKGEVPDVLHMTATPIPRTLSITVFGEMDVSTIDEMPKGRQPVDTYWVKKELWPRIVNFIRKECQSGRQAYVICPLIEESEKLDLENAQEVFEQLVTELAPLRVGLLHGRMPPAEKEEVMRLFAENDVQVLVSTTVVEVGVNVPNATVMVIYDADRFGLAQLHQLRGRVGRGGGASTCILVANPKSETGNERMRIMTETTDGFEISRRDLMLRGPGDFLGVKQSGLPDFKVADLNQDFTVLEYARADAAEYVSRDDFATSEETKPLYEYLCAQNLTEVNFD
ncbi:ATP-dependent DNA helicase RecG [Thermoactinomyces intermedius]|jgi:ATP-dependent DNA helicase RecG|uniref:ATP-dependent DNA helicase RecG n=1 Tax=Thermoactinomyces intermedius TaxID=2024 RepID=A0A8I1AAG1_THEIN|nr:MULTISPECIES: ATP-dependent DNA helicase RecG [Thermoactinomyces]MBA4547493.1 ATP-dependent DNA helicase RecG [Thermoactinomyces intermedius]MBA4836081.1 ATP-dependent DNA helicase RecG [Thermoactinomyces intermedius]MBH8594277.1 ATP-dependent DNA helicase RecG [Thermoactinomyces intermedius]MBH8601113.1 ATP-dependent DNA helicase RecG [Thermoactinomyces sp. CICC 23799]